LSPYHLDSKLLSQGVPARYQHCSFANYMPTNLAENQTKQIVQKLAKTVTCTKSGLILTSDKPNGKTHLVISLIRALLLEGKIYPRFVDTPELLKQLEPLENFFSKEQNYLLENTCKSSLLILDNVTSNYSESQKNNLEYIIGYRYRNILPLVITTRLNEKDFSQAVTPAICSRLYEMCSIVKLD
ncbi:MAG: ATP-binding protein, partial [Blastocatellia bacterium]